MRTTLKAAFAAVTMLAASPAIAETHDTFHAGIWSAFSGTATDTGAPMCGMEAEGTDRVITFKYVQGGRSLVVDLLRAGWQWAQGQEVPVQLMFDGAEFHALAQAGVMPDGGPMVLEFYVGSDTIDGFSRALQLGLRMTIAFPGTDEPTWTGGMAGSAATFGVFNSCVGLISQMPAAPRENLTSF